MSASSRVDPHGNPIIISGNHGRRVGEAAYPRSRVIAYVMPSDRRPVSEPQVAERAMPNPQAAPNRAPSEHTIDSPITELLAAIEAEENRSAAKPARPLTTSAPPALHLVQQMPPTVPHLTVRQMPERPPHAVQQPLPQRLMPLRPQPRRHVASADVKIIRQ